MNWWTLQISKDFKEKFKILLETLACLETFENVLIKMNMNNIWNNNSFSLFVPSVVVVVIDAYSKWNMRIINNLILLF